MPNPSDAVDEAEAILEDAFLRTAGAAYQHWLDREGLPESVMNDLEEFDILEEAVDLYLQSIEAGDVEATAAAFDHLKSLRA